MSAANTRIFAVRNILVGHCGENLTRDNIDRIVGEFAVEMEGTGGCSWAFQAPEKPTSTSRT
jgi:hypothetical protein